MIDLSKFSVPCGNGGEAVRDRSQASSGAGPSQHPSGDPEISRADSCSARRRFTGSTALAEGEEMTLPPNSNIRWTPEEDQRLLDLCRGRGYLAAYRLKS